MVMNEKTKTKQENLVTVYSELCSGCGYCQLACSLVKTGVFNPAASRIKLNRVDGIERYAISFSEDCDHCGYCAKYCFYGVLRGGKLMADSAWHSTAGYQWF